MKKKNSTYIHVLISCLSLLVILIAWYVCINIFHIKSELVFPGPIKVINTFFKKMYVKAPDGGTLFQHLFASVKIALLGYLLGVIIGVPLGIAMAWNKTVDRFVRPLFDLIRPIPGIAWIPMFILLFGIGVTSKVLVIFLGALIPCTVNSYTGIRQTKDVHLWVGEVFGATNPQLLLRIAIPTATPMIFTGMRVALGASWTALVAAELLASTKGLGYMITQARSISRPDIIIVGMIVIGLIGALFDSLLHVVELKVAKGMNMR